MLKLKKTLLTLAAGILISVIWACQSESNPEITRAEYITENTFAVYYVGDPGYSVDFTVDGKDNRYTVKSTLLFTLLSTKAVCEIYERFISGDHITVTSSRMLGSAEFDVPDYRE
jgi:hypothetical protein